MQSFASKEILTAEKLNTAFTERASALSLITHEELDIAHGVTSAVVGEDDIQTLTNKTLVAPVIGVATGTSFNAITGLATVAPLAPAVAAVVGIATSVARQDHVHPIDTSRAALAGDVAQDFAANELLAQSIYSKEIVITDSTTVGRGKVYLVDARLGSIQITLDPDALAGDTATVSDMYNQFYLNPLKAAALEVQQLDTLADPETTFPRPIGCNPDSQIPEGFLGDVNTPPTADGMVTVRTSSYDWINVSLVPAMPTTFNFILGTPSHAGTIL